MTADNAPAQLTPAQLAEQIRTFDNFAPDADERMKRIIKDAEDGGDEHMKAVVDALFDAGQLAGVRIRNAAVGPSSVYDVSTGRAAFHESNVLLELRVRINGRSFVVREAIDPVMFELRFRDDAELEKFIEHFVRRSCGTMAADPEGYRYLRELVWIVRPGDRHDFKRCADGWRAHPHCDLGLISKAPPISPVFASAADAAIESPMRRDDALGVCPCRCHQHNESRYRAESVARAYGLPGFCEEMLDEDGFPR